MAARAWQRMLSGRRLDLLDPAPKDIEIEDIAHGLARVARWNGQTVGDHAYSCDSSWNRARNSACAIATGAGSSAPRRWRRVAGTPRGTPK